MLTIVISNTNYVYISVTCVWCFQGGFPPWIFNTSQNALIAAGPGDDIPGLKYAVDIKHVYVAIKCIKMDLERLSVVHV